MNARRIRTPMPISRSGNPLPSTVRRPTWRSTGLGRRRRREGFMEAPFGILSRGGGGALAARRDDDDAVAGELEHAQARARIEELPAGDDVDAPALDHRDAGGPQRGEGDPLLPLEPEPAGVGSGVLLVGEGGARDDHPSPERRAGKDPVREEEGGRDEEDGDPEEPPARLGALLEREDDRRDDGERREDRQGAEGGEEDLGDEETQAEEEESDRDDQARALPADGGGILGDPLDEDPVSRDLDDPDAGAPPDEVPRRLGVEEPPGDLDLPGGPQVGDGEPRSADELDGAGLQQGGRSRPGGGREEDEAAQERDRGEEPGDRPDPHPHADEAVGEGLRVPLHHGPVEGMAREGEVLEGEEEPGHGARTADDAGEEGTGEHEELDGEEPEPGEDEEEVVDVGEAGQVVPEEEEAEGDEGEDP